MRWGLGLECHAAPTDPHDVTIRQSVQIKVCTPPDVSSTQMGLAQLGLSKFPFKRFFHRFYLHTGVQQSCVEPPFAFKFACPSHWSVPPLVAAWLERVPCQGSAPSLRLSLPACAGRTTMHLDCTAPTWTGISVVYRVISGKRKQAETHGSRFGASLVVVSWPSFLLRRVVSGRIRPKEKEKK